MGAVFHWTVAFGPLLHDQRAVEELMDLWDAMNLTGEAAEVGYCTAPCATSAQCPTSYACDAVAGVCVR